VMKFANKHRIVKDSFFELPPVFKMIQKESGASWKEMFEVFNMGHRMEIYVKESVAQKIIDIATNFEIGAKIIGRVEQADQKELVIKALGEELRY